MIIWYKKYSFTIFLQMLTDFIFLQPNYHVSSELTFHIEKSWVYKKVNEYLKFIIIFDHFLNYKIFSCHNFILSDKATLLNIISRSLKPKLSKFVYLAKLVFSCVAPASWVLQFASCHQIVLEFPQNITWHILEWVLFHSTVQLVIYIVIN